MKKTIRIFGVLASLMIMLSLTGCYYDEVVVQVIPTNNDVSFKTDIQPILNTNCISCHTTIVQPNLTVGKSYANLKAIPGGIVPGDAAGSELVDMLKHDPSNPNPMPPQGPILAKDISLIVDWINQGALDN